MRKYLKPSEACTAAQSLPLDCAFHLSTWTMLGQGVEALLESAAVFGLCALLLDALFSKGWISKFPTATRFQHRHHQNRPPLISLKHFEANLSISIMT